MANPYDSGFTPGNMQRDTQAALPVIPNNGNPMGANNMPGRPGAPMANPDASGGGYYYPWMRPSPAMEAIRARMAKMQQSLQPSTQPISLAPVMPGYPAGQPAPTSPVMPYAPTVGPDVMPVPMAPVQPTVAPVAAMPGQPTIPTAGVGGMGIGMGGGGGGAGGGMGGTGMLNPGDLNRIY